jgi:arylsulfatase
MSERTPGEALRWLPRGAVVIVVLAACVLVWREGGGADPRPRPPRAEVSSAGPPRTAPAAPPGRGTEAYEVTARLVEKLGDARLDVPTLGAAQAYLQPYWRKMRVPWTPLPPLAAQLATTIALRTSAGVEAQWSVLVPGEKTWVPEARVWNMNEGSFDQREAIFAPTPATIAFPLDVPAQARLRASPSTLVPLGSTTVFDVVIAPAGAAEHEVSRTRIQGGDARRWVDVDVDLAPWAGQHVELRLRSWTDKPGPSEKKWQPPQEEPDAGTGGATGGGSAGTGAGAGTGAEAAPAGPPMSLAFWGDPVVVARRATRVPYDVLWIVVDALRPDVAASLHDPAEDAAALAAPRPPLEARLPAVPGMMPGIDRLGARGVRFLHAWSAGAWTRPGTLAMLTGDRSSELGIDTREWILSPEAIAHYYAAEPPLLPRILRRSGVATAAFVNNFFMAGYAGVGLDLGFERVTDHRYRVRDTAEITRDASAWLDAHADDRFFLFVNYNSPHEPYEAPKELLARIPAPPAGPKDREVRQYMGECAKDDAAIATLLGKIDALGLAPSTLVVVTSDHGETLSAAHAGYAMDHLPVRFHHAVGNFEETTRVPIVLALPGVLDGGRAVSARVRTTDLAPTVLEVEGLEADPRMSGASLVALARGGKEADARPVVTEGRASRALLWDRWHLVVHDGHEGPDAEDQLYDLVEDPGERRNVAHAHPDVVAELKARLAAAVAGVRPADAAPTEQAPLPVVHLRFAGAGRARRVSGAIAVGDGKHGASVFVEAAGIPPEAVRIDGPRVDFALTTAPDAAVGFDLRVDPAGAPIAWKLFLDDQPWPERAVFAGAWGLPAVAARAGLAADDARTEAYAAALPTVDPARDLGLFVTRDRPGDAPGAGPVSGGAGAVEMQRMLEQWGYAHGSH